MSRLKMPKDVKEYRVKCYVNQDGITVFRCPKCETTEIIDTNKSKYAFRSFRAKCRCGAVIAGLNEFRRCCRKKVHLKGFYKNRKTESEGDIFIENISLTGIDFRCLRKHNLQNGDRLDINFTLDNRKKSKVTLFVEVLHVDDGLIGVKRCDLKKMHPELLLYLR